MTVRKILIVDDEPIELLAMKKVISKVGCHIITASSGKEAIDKATEEMPDLIFLDIVMDDMDGYYTCRQIIKAPKTKDIPIVFVSSKNQKADQIWAKKQGGRALISKPFKEEQILEQVRLYL